MKNHYTKVKNAVDFKIYNELESFVYNSLVEDELTSEENLRSLIVSQVKREHGSLIYSSIEIEDTIKNLIIRKIIKEAIKRRYPMQTYFEVWATEPNGKTRIKIAEYEEIFWQRAEKKALSLELQGYTKIVVFEKMRTTNK
jgi:hypothetical protein